MSNTTAEINGFFSPCFYTPKNGEKATSENIRRAYHSLNPKPNILKTISPAIYTGIGATILGILGSIFGFTKDSSLAKWLGSGLAIIGLVLTGAGKFAYGVDLSTVEPTPVVKPKDEGKSAEPPAVDSSQITSEEEQRLLKIMGDPQEDFTKRARARSLLSLSKIRVDEKKEFDEMVLKLKGKTSKEVEALGKRLKESTTLDKLIAIAINKKFDDEGRLKAINLLVDCLKPPGSPSVDQVKKITSTLFKCYVEKDLISNGFSAGDLDLCSLADPVKAILNYINARLRQSTDQVSDYNDLVAEVTPFTQGEITSTQQVATSILLACKNPLAVKLMFEHLKFISRHNGRDILFDDPTSTPQYIDCITPLSRLIEFKFHSSKNKAEIKSIIESYLKDPNQSVRCCANELIKELE